MNKTHNAVPSNGTGLFTRSGFFTKHRVRAVKSVQVVRRKSYEAATSAQAARLLEVLGSETASPLRF